MDHALASAIKQATGEDTEGFNVAIEASEILHIHNQHGNQKTKALKFMINRIGIIIQWKIKKFLVLLIGDMIRINLILLAKN